MTLYQIIDTLKKIALTQPNIRTATDGDVFDAMNSNPSIKYGVFHVTQTTHTEDEQFDNFGLNLFVIDRLEDDDSNRVSVQSTAKQLLSNIIGTFCETFDAEHNNITYQIFTQRFKDLTAGVWATVTFQVLKDYSCAEAYGDGVWRPEISIINNQDINITKNGIYEPSEGFTGFGKVDVYVPVPMIQESVSLRLTAGDVGVYRPEESYDGVAEVIYEVQPNQSKVLEVTENGDYTVLPDAGYGGIGIVEVAVNVPDLNGSYDEGYGDGYQEGKTQGVADYIDGLPTLDITENGVYDQPNKGVNVNVPPAKINPIEAGIAFGFSTFTKIPDIYEFPEELVWKNEGMFYNGYLKDISALSNIKRIVLRQASFITFKNMFNLNTQLEDITPLTDWRIVFEYNSPSNLLDMQYFMSTTSVKDLTPISNLMDLLKASGYQYNLNLQQAFNARVKRFDLPWDFSKVSNYNQMLGSGADLEYVCELDATNVTGGYNPLNIVQLYSNNTTLTYFGGFKNQKLSIDNTYFFTRLPNLTRESCLAIVNNLYDFTGNGETPASGQGKLKVHANFLTALGDDVNIATNKGWVISVG